MSARAIGNNESVYRDENEQRLFIGLASEPDVIQLNINVNNGTWLLCAKVYIIIGEAISGLVNIPTHPL